MSNHSPQTPADLLPWLIAHRWRWLAPILIATAAAAGYAVVRQPQWEATQALVLRDEAAGDGQGRFDTQEALQSAQQLALELAGSRDVVAAALAEVGPPAGRSAAGAWPSAREVENACRRIRLQAAGDGELGRSELLRLSVRAASPQRAAALAQAVLEQVDLRIRTLRNRRAQSLVQELKTARRLAAEALAESTRRLAEIEAALGADLPELRNLSESLGGESQLRRTLVELQSQRNEADLARRTTARLLELLIAAKRQPGRLAALPNALLDTRPALRQLKAGLVAAQLESARLLGQLTEAHPRAQAALAAERQMEQRIEQELAAATADLQTELQLQADRVRVLDQQLAEAAARMNRLAAARADYANLVDEVARRRATLADADRDLAAAKATLAAAPEASQIAELTAPLVGPDPVGPRKAVLLLGGLLAGLAGGFAVVLVTAPSPTQGGPVGDAAPRPSGDGRRPASAPPRRSLASALQRVAAASARHN